MFLFISYPNVVQDQNMFTDLVEEVKKNGHEVFVVTPEFEMRTAIVNEGGISVLRVKSGRLFNVNSIVKGVNTVLLPFRFKKALDKLLQYKEFDWIVTSTPPITFYLLIQQLKRKYNCKAYLILRDIFPQNARDLKIFTNSLLFKIFRRQEKRLYRIVDVIGCMSQGNIDYVIRHNHEIEQKKMTLLPNWIKPEILDRKERSSLKKYGLENKFIAVFGGNFGKPQGIDFILDLAERVQYLKEVVFLLIGGGTETERIKLDIEHRKLKNVQIYKKIPRKDFRILVKQCHIGLVNLSEKFTIPNIPSRTLSYWEAGLPILAAIDACTDYGKILEKANGGLYSITGDLDAYYSNFLKLYRNPELRKIMGENGRKEIRSIYSVTSAYRNFLNQLY